MATATNPQQANTKVSQKTADPLFFSAQNIFKVLHQTRIADVIQHRNERMAKQGTPVQQLIDVNENARVGDVVKLLADNGILAVPVHRISKENIKHYLGVVSVYDVLAWTVFQRVFDDLDAYNLEFDKQSEQPTGDNLDDKYLQILQEQSQYFNTKIKDLLGATFESSDSWTLYASDPISSMLQIMTASGYHRVLIIDDTVYPKNVSDNKNTSKVIMLTQSDLLSYIKEKGPQLHRQDFETLMKTQLINLEELALRRKDADPNQLDSKTIRRRVIKVSNKLTALTAFRVLYNHRVSAVAVVDEKNELVANLSASDLRGITNENLENLMMPVFEYLEQGMKRSPEQPAADQLRVLKSSDRAEDALETLFNSRIHRVWTVDQRDVPTGVVTMTDLLSLFVPLKDTTAEE